MKLVAFCLCLGLLLAGVVAAAPGAPVPVSPSLWESIARYADWFFPRPAPTGIPDAAFNTFGLSYQCMVPGTFNIPSIHMQNTGTMTWNETNQIRLGAVGESGGDAAKFGPLRVRIESGKDVLPGETYIFEVPFTAPQTRGNYTPSYRMIWEGHTSFGDTAAIPIQVTTPCPYPDLSAVWTGWNVPATTPGVMTTGQRREARIRVMNTGTRTWNESGKVRLGAVGDAVGEAAKFGVGRVLLPAGVNVQGIVNNQPVEDQYLFTFDIIAPSEPGVYRPAFRMLQEGNRWFGPQLTVPIEVVAPLPPVPEYGSRIVSWEVPALQSGQIAPGRVMETEITLMNTGSRPWENHYPWEAGDAGLNSDAGRFDPHGTDGSENVMFRCVKNGLSVLSVYSGETCRVQFPLTAPDSPGTYNLHFRMAYLKNGNNIQEFGENLTITVQVRNASAFSPHRLQDRLNETMPGLNFQISGSNQVSGTMPAGTPAPLPVEGQVQPSPSAGINGVRVPVIPAATRTASPHLTRLTTPAAPSLQPVAARTFRTDNSVIKPLPKASFVLIPEAGTAPLSVTCDASASTPGTGTIQSFAWNFGDGTTGTGTPVTHVYTGAGTYTVTLAVTGSSGQAASASRQVVVSPPATAQVVHIVSERPRIHLF